MPEGATVIPFVDSAKLYWSKGVTSVSKCARFGLGEFEDMAFCLHFLRNEDTFVDAGANVGVYTVLASAVVGAQTVAFEPAPDTYRLLLTNIRLNDIANKVDARNSGLAENAGILNFTTGLNSFNHVVNSSVSSSIEVPVERMDDAISGAVDLVKMDVEGYESKAIKGAERIFENGQLSALTIEISPLAERYGSSGAALFEMLADYGFHPFWYEPFTRSFLEPRRHDHLHRNAVFIRDFDRVKKRVESAPLYRVNGNEI